MSTNVQTHTVESNGQLRFRNSAIASFLIYLYSRFDRIQCGNQIQAVYLQREKEDVGVQSEFELPGYLKIAVDASHISTFIHDQLRSDQPITVRNIGTQVIFHIYDEIVLENDFQLFEKDFMQTVSQIHRFCFFLCIVVLILSYEKVNIHCCDEARRKILYVHFGHISEMSSHVGRNIKFHIQFVIFLCLNEHE